MSKYLIQYFVNKFCLQILVCVDKMFWINRWFYFIMNTFSFQTSNFKLPAISLTNTFTISLDHDSG